MATVERPRVPTQPSIAPIARTPTFHAILAANVLSPHSSRQAVLLIHYPVADGSRLVISRNGDRRCVFHTAVMSARESTSETTENRTYNAAQCDAQTIAPHSTAPGRRKLILMMEKGQRAACRGYEHECDRTPNILSHSCSRSTEITIWTNRPQAHRHSVRYRTHQYYSRFHSALWAVVRQ